MTDPRIEMVADGLLTVTEAEELTGLGRSTLYECMDRGELPYLKFGRARRIPRNALLAFMAAHYVG